MLAAGNRTGRLEQNRQLASSRGRQEARKAVLEALEAGRKQQRPARSIRCRQEAAEAGTKQQRPAGRSGGRKEAAKADSIQQRPAGNNTAGAAEAGRKQ